jgi:PleD family two-component response regulator
MSVGAVELLDFAGVFHDALIALSPNDEEERVHPALADIALAENCPSLINLRLLVVDDEIGGREVISKILAYAQTEVRTAENAERRVSEFGLMAT